jgi:type I restriction enzyme S subunit
MMTTPRTVTDDTQRRLTPKLRFPEFRDEPGWQGKELRALADPVSERATNEGENNVLTLSAEQGLVLQNEYFEKQVAGTNAERYLKIQRDDFVYNDRTTKAFAYGTIKRLSSHQHGIVSPIYKCFRFKEGEVPAFWEWYFEGGAHEAQLRNLANEGARAGRFNVTIDRFLSTSVWVPESGSKEQQKIAGCLSSLDELIGNEGRKLDALKSHKKGLMQQLFPREGESRPRLRLPEFQDAPEWDDQPLSTVAANLDCKRVPITKKDRERGGIPYYGASGVVDYVGAHLFDEDLLCVSEDGANLVARTCPIAFSISGKTWVNNHAHVLRFEDMATQKLVEDYLNFVDLTDYITGIAQPKLSKAMLDSIAVPLPQVAERQRIASCLSSLDELIAAQSIRIEALKSHKKGLMQQLFPLPEGSEDD